MSAESFYDQACRVDLMASDDGDTWDLSDNDRAAITAVMAKLRAYEAELERLMDFVMPREYDSIRSVLGIVDDAE